MTFLSHFDIVTVFTLKKQHSCKNLVCTQFFVVKIVVLILKLLTISTITLPSVLML